MSTRPLTLAQAAQQVRDGSLSSAELTRSALARCDEVDPQLGVFLHRRDEQALADAERADAELGAGKDRGPLHGIPIGVKDVVATADMPTTGQSLVTDGGWRPGLDATVVARLRAAGAVLVGKTTTMELAAGCPDAEKPFPVPRNPWNTDHWAGGSSSGSASGLATGCFLGAVGSDTGGSVRLPAAWCGVSGIKPTFGRVSKQGVIPLAWSFDHVGPLARTAQDCALLLQVMAGYDGSDPHSVDVPVPDYAAALDGDLAGLTIGVEKAQLAQAQGVDPSVLARFDAAIQVLSDAGAAVVDVSLPWAAELKAACVAVMLSEPLAYHRAALQSRWSDFGRDTRFGFGLGAFFTGADLVQARRVIAACRREVDALLEGVDVIASPTVGAGAPPLEGLSMLSLIAYPAFTTIWDGLGHPALTVPMGLTDSGLPAGLQLVGRHWDEATVLRAGDAFQRLTDHHLAAPALAL